METKKLETSFTVANFDLFQSALKGFLWKCTLNDAVGFGDTQAQALCNAYLEWQHDHKATVVLID